ncbi:MAG: hypothetical protein JO332_10740, partial [Planctomycetaceae bacterium]|nr:hypothetical protein [Planctomycetaceae bacterium]
MITLRVSSLLSALILLGACSASGRSAAPRAGSGDAKDGLDAVRLVTGETVTGRILEDNGRQVVIDRETVVSAYPRSA